MSTQVMNNSSSPMAPAQDPGSPVAVGGPGASMEASSPGNLPVAPAATAPVAPNPAAAATPTTVVIGDRIFTSQEAALEYARELDAQRKLTAQQAPIVQAPVAPKPQVKVSDLLFEDPETAVKLLEDQIEDKIEKKNQAKQFEQNLWRDFYDKHPDLKGFEEAVEFQKAKHWGQIANVPIHQSLPYLAQQTRSYLSKVRGSAHSGEKLTSGPAMVAGSSGATPPPVQAAPNKPSSFIDEVKALGRRKIS